MTQRNKKSKLSIVALGFIFIGVTLIFIKNFMPEYVNSSGMLIEPYFFLIPIGFGNIFLGLILCVVNGIKNKMNKYRVG